MSCRQTNQKSEPQDPGFDWPLQKALPGKIEKYLRLTPAMEYNFNMVPCVLFVCDQLGAYRPFRTAVEHFVDMHTTL
jgi:hypothetical protein